MTEIDTSHMSNELPQDELVTALEFVKRNIVPVRSGRRCVDGRYERATEETGTIARAGADGGILEAVVSLNDELSLGLTPQECFDTVYNAVTADGGTFYWHSDERIEHETHEHANDGVVKSGCGHLQKAMSEATAAGYKVNPESMRQAFVAAKQKQASDAHMHLVILPGDHREKGVLVVTGTQRTVNSSDAQAMYFVYDQKRDQEYVQAIAEKLGVKQLTSEVLQARLDEQTEATLHNLALGKPIFTVNADGPDPVVTSVGTVS